ncbi:MAG: DeoR/GlpR family DNA-binding transcription regulator [Acidimicrobiales bacterium]|jgi:DeoR family transcriptional regulator of aga operon
MLRAERLAALLEVLASQRSVDVATMAGEFGVSSATVRRDLRTLHEQGLLVRTHGGAIPSDLDLELPVRYRTSRRRSEKHRIALAAAELVSDGSVVGLTGGTTTTELARTLADRDSITIVTNALNIASELVLRSSIRLVVIGGSARHASYELVGPSAELMLSRYHLDVAFIGTDGITLTAGCTTHDEMEAQTDRAFLHRSKRVVVTADSSKLGKSAFARICDITEIDDLVTDDEADPSLLSEFVDAGVHIITC